jgi:hypothetical protein
MRWNQGLRLLCGLAGLSSSVYAQCFDLTSIHLYDLKGRFQERWDKPIWDAKPGEGNFQLDESPWFGGLQEFVVFSIGHVQKAGSNWLPLHASRRPEVWCAESPQRNSYLFCYWAPYQTPPPGAFRGAPTQYDRETWVMGQDGVLRYTRRTQGEGPADHTYDFGSSVEAVLNLNTGAYSVVAHVHSKGHYTKRIPEGVEVWRDTTLSARAELTPQACPAVVRKVTFGSGRGAREQEAKPVPICVVRVRGNAATSPDFIANPMHKTSPDGCIVAHEEPISGKIGGSGVAQRE